MMTRSDANTPGIGEGAITPASGEHLAEVPTDAVGASRTFPCQWVLRASSGSPPQTASWRSARFGKERAKSGEPRLQDHL